MVRTLARLVAVLVLLPVLPVHAGIERFIVKDKITTVRVLLLDGDRVEERVFDPRGYSLIRMIDLNTGQTSETVPRQSPFLAAGDQIQELETPLGRAMCVVRRGTVIARQYRSRHAVSPRAIELASASLLSLAPTQVDSRTPHSPSSLALAFYDKLGVFIPGTVQEQSIFGAPATGRLFPGDLVFLARSARGVPEDVVVVLPDGVGLLWDHHSLQVRRKALQGLPGFVTGRRRILGTSWEAYLTRAPMEAMPRLGPSRKLPLGERIRGVATYYDHGEEPKKQKGPHRYTMAHRSLPLGTKARVTLLASGRSVECVVTDRRHFENDRSFEVCYEAARKLGLEQLGVGLVLVQVFK
jgi:rare lipoprotein A